MDGINIMLTGVNPVTASLLLTLAIKFRSSQPGKKKKIPFHTHKHVFMSFLFKNVKLDYTKGTLMPAIF